MGKASVLEKESPKPRTQTSMPPGKPPKGPVIVIAFGEPRDKGNKKK